MRFLHTMIRVYDLDAALHFFCDLLGLEEVRRRDSERGRFSLIFLQTPRSSADAEVAAQADNAQLELTWNWDEPAAYSGGRNFGHVAFAVDDIYGLCARLQAAGVCIARPPRDGYMAFVRSPDGISVELLQKGERLAPQEPWASMESTPPW